jgi:Lectin C-type domain
MQQSEKESPVLGSFPDLIAPMCTRKHFDVYSPPLDWKSASDFCTAKNMNLATFKTYDEAAYFLSLTVDIVVWVGINDLATPGTFVQVSGFSTPALPWYLGKPNNVGGTHRCVHLNYLGFIAGTCVFPLPFACEWYDNVPCEHADQNPIFHFIKLNVFSKCFF